MVTLVVDEWLRERRPRPDLAGWLLYAWRGDLGDAVLPLPDERIDLVRIADGSLWVSGPETRSWSERHLPGTTAVGVAFLPGLGPPLLHVSAAELRDRRVRLDDLWGDREAQELAERVAARADDRGRVEELERAVRRLAGSALPVDGVARWIASELDRPQPVPVRDLARSTGLSERQIHRRCTAAFGYGPAVLTRMLRLRRVLRFARAHRGPLRLAGLAAAAGYYDQQHLARDVRAIMGTTPTDLLRSR